MSRITGTDAANLIEAYNSVYAPQEDVELTEEQVQEDFENWVNSLVEEGHDLSEYTWEDMYEAYLSEIPINPAGNRPISNAPYQSRFARPMNAGTPQQTGRATPVSRPQVSNLGSNYRGQELAATARARASQVGTPRQGTAGGPTVGGNTPIGPAKTPAPAPTRPAPAPTTAPGSQRPTAAPATPATPAATPPGPPSRYNPLMQRTFGYQTGNAPDQIAKASAGASPTPSGSSLGAAANPDVRKKLNLPQKNLNQDLDLFDIVKGYLIDEGYAETEEAAAVIMANMSDEWRQSIVEQYTINVADVKGNTKAAQNAQAGMKNKLTGKPMYTPGVGVGPDFKLVKGV